jgi:hypothetical protein
MFSLSENKDERANEKWVEPDKLLIPYVTCSDVATSDFTSMSRDN